MVAPFALQLPALEPVEDEHMDHMDNFRERFEALERRTQMVEQRLRWWRGMAGGLLVLGLLSWALPLGKAADAPGRGMAERMATVEKKLAAMDFDDAANEVVITGANLRIVNGLGSTTTTNGLGNLIVGYNEPRSGSIFCPVPMGPLCTDTRTGSHNIVVGRFDNFSSFGGIVIGDQNEISGEFSSVLAGLLNTASGLESLVSGGQSNTASGKAASVGGGFANGATGDLSWVTGDQNTASGVGGSVSGGFGNTASGGDSSVSGGQNNTASGDFSSVSGGLNRTAPTENNWAAGALFSNN
jgi:hypothetical protein